MIAEFSKFRNRFLFPILTVGNSGVIIMAEKLEYSNLIATRDKHKKDELAKIMKLLKSL